MMLTADGCIDGMVKYSMDNNDPAFRQNLGIPRLHFLPKRLMVGGGPVGSVRCGHGGGDRANNYVVAFRL
jgi:hypothetical protein